MLSKVKIPNHCTQWTPTRCCFKRFSCLVQIIASKTNLGFALHLLTPVVRDVVWSPH